MKPQINDLINEAVQHMILHSSDNSKIQQLTKRHENKIHFIPSKYRVFGGVLQSLNIQFGNFIEELMKVLIQNESQYEIVEELSGKKNTTFLLSKENDNLIDQYITDCQTSRIGDIREEFPKLLTEIINNNDTEQNSFKHDIDLLFRDKRINTYFYLEIKYNDDHDTGKFVDINRKFIKTYAYLVRYLNITDKDNLIPILFFFNNRKMKGNIYIPEETNIFRGKRFFDEFLSIPYDTIDNYMSNLSESSDVYKMFDDLYNKIRYGR